ncbi:MAG: Vms1/Ankzf1 family peptidyl-tRNA hydrolase [Candidatus Nanohaloarchaea archaeon]
MKLPWGDGDEREELLENELEELREEKQRLEERFEAEKERRSKLSREKQEAQEELNRLRDRVRSLEAENGDEEEADDSRGFRDISVEEARSLLEKLSTVESPEEDLLTIYSPGEFESLDDLKGLKNALPQQRYGLVSGREGFAAFMDDTVFSIVLRTRPFFEPGWSLSDSFSPGRLLDFLDSEKTWVLVSAGETRVFRESSGRSEEVESVKTRVDSKHSSGGFSQGRFERKRDEQVEEHLEQVEEVLEEYDDIYLLGDRSLCKQLRGEYMGGFDPNQGRPEVFYSFQLLS